MSQQQIIRRWVMTGAVTAITVTGALYGAGLKSRQELKQVRRPTATVPSLTACIFTCSSRFFPQD